MLASGKGLRAAEPPNILLIVTDEHNFRTLGCYRDHLLKEQAEMWGPGVIVETPHIDRLAKEGVLSLEHMRLRRSVLRVGRQ